MPGSQCTATLVNVAMRTVPAERPRSSAAVWSSCSCERRMSRRNGMIFSPSGVRRAPVRLRVRSGKPNSSSSAAMMWLTPDCVSPSSSAAFVSEESSTVFSKTSYFFVSMKISSCNLAR